MALVWRDGLELPDGRARLYQQLSFAYLENIERHRFKDTQRPITPPLGATVQDMERWLAAIAWHMQRRRHSVEHEIGAAGSAALEIPALIVISRGEAENILSKVIADTTIGGEPMLRLANALGLVEFPAELLHSELEGVVLYGCTRLANFKTLPSMPKLKIIALQRCSELTDLQFFAVFDGTELR
jgi:hypothetical protein